MGPISNIIFFFNVSGVFFTVVAMVIVAHASLFVVGALRRGLCSFLWGLAFILISFFSVLLQIYIPDFPPIQSILVSIGMVLILFSAKRLFAFHHATGISTKN